MLISNVMNCMISNCSCSCECDHSCGCYDYMHCGFCDLYCGSNNV